MLCPTRAHILTRPFAYNHRAHRTRVHQSLVDRLIFMSEDDVRTERTQQGRGGAGGGDGGSDSGSGGEGPAGKDMPSSVVASGGGGAAASGAGSKPKQLFVLIGDAGGSGRVWWWFSLRLVSSAGRMGRWLDELLIIFVSVVGGEFLRGSNRVMTSRG